MNRQEFQALIKNKPIFLDGATGSNLQKKGMPAGVCPEQWILEHRDIMIALQREFVEAGSQIVYVPTFTANRIKLKDYPCVPESTVPGILRRAFPFFAD